MQSVRLSEYDVDARRMKCLGFCARRNKKSNFKSAPIQKNGFMESSEILAKLWKMQREKYLYINNQDDSVSYDSPSDEDIEIWNQEM